MENIRNAVIDYVSLGREDHGIMTFYIGLRSGSCGVVVGGYALDEYDELLDKRVVHPKSMELITRILEVVGVDKWEDLVGKYIRYVDHGLGCIVYEIGNIFEDEWLNLRKFFKEERN